MPFKFNIFTGNLDVVEAPPDQYIDGEVEYHSNLPVTVGTPLINSAFLVRKGEGLYFVNRKPSGIWVRETNNGNLDDWKYAGTFSDLYRDANFRIINNADASKELAFDVSGVTSGQTRTLTVPDKSGTIATTDAADLTSGTLADARLSSNVARRDAANTFSANQTLNGTNNVAPNQTAASGSSIMTRDLADERLFMRSNARTWPIIGSALTTSNSGSGGAIANGPIILVTTGSTVNSVGCGSFMNTRMPAMIPHGVMSAGGYGGIPAQRGVLFDFAVTIGASPVTTGVVRAATHPMSATDFICTQGWQLRFEYTNTSNVQARFATRINPSLQNAPTITGATNASPIVITTSAAHGLSNGDTVEVGQVGGNTAANGIWTVASVTATTFELQGSTGNGAYTSGGGVQRVSGVLVSGFTGLFRAFVRWNGGTASLVIGDDPLASPVSSFSVNTNSGNFALNGLSLRANNTVAQNIGHNGIWLGPCYVSVR